jgi:hypothetical protein
VILAIADPPYPPLQSPHGLKRRASRWYGSGQHAATDKPSDWHPDAAEWDDPARHRQLLVEMADVYEGFAIATTADGIAAYGVLPPGMRIMVWVKTNAMPGPHRLVPSWEAVLLYPAVGRRSSRTSAGAVRDVWTGAAPRVGFPGAKPEGWTHWVLGALSYNPYLDSVVDVFPGSGLVSAAVGTYGRG